MKRLHCKNEKAKDKFAKFEVEDLVKKLATAVGDIRNPNTMTPNEICPLCYCPTYWPKIRYECDILNQILPLCYDCQMVARNEANPFQYMERPFTEVEYATWVIFQMHYKGFDAFSQAWTHFAWFHNDRVIEWARQFGRSPPEKMLSLEDAEEDAAAMVPLIDPGRFENAVVFKSKYIK